MIEVRKATTETRGRLLSDVEGLTRQTDLYGPAGRASDSTIWQPGCADSPGPRDGAGTHVAADRDGM